MKRSRPTRLSLGLVLVATLLAGVSSATASGITEQEIPRRTSGCRVVVYAGPVSVCL